MPTSISRSFKNQWLVFILAWKQEFHPTYPPIHSHISAQIFAVWWMSSHSPSFSDTENDMLSQHCNPTPFRNREKVGISSSEQALRRCLPGYQIVEGKKRNEFPSYFHFPDLRFSDGTVVGRHQFAGRADISSAMLPLENLALGGGQDRDWKVVFHLRMIVNLAV